MAKELQRGVAQVELGGKVRNLRYDLNAFALLEEKWGDVELSEMWDYLLDKHSAAQAAGKPPRTTPRVRDIRTLIWAGLAHEDDSLTEQQVGAWIDTSNLQACIEAANAAMNAAVGDDESESDVASGNATGPNAKGGTGKKSGARRSAHSA